MKIRSGIYDSKLILFGCVILTGYSKNRSPKTLLSNCTRIVVKILVFQTVSQLGLSPIVTFTQYK